MSITGIGSSTNTTSTTNTSGSSTSSSSGSTTSSSSGSTGSSGSSSGNGISGTGLLSSLGIGSGLDVTSIITALVNAKKAGPEQQITSQTTKDQTLITGLTSLDSVLSSLKSSLDDLTSSSTYTAFDASFADSSLGTASTLSFAVPGTYNVDVQSLATAQKRLSNSYATDSPVGTGTLTIGVGSNSVDINVGSSDTIGDIANKINASSDNPGVTAAVVNGVNGSQLVLTSTKTGVANAFTVSASGGSSTGVSDLATALGTAGSNEAADAQLSIDGVSVSSASNTVTGALTGVTLDLAATGTSTLTVKQNTDKITSAVQAFVDAYNSYASTTATLSSYNPDTQQAGILLGDSTLSSVQRQISSVLGAPVSGSSIASLANLGITRSADGTLSLDSNKLSSAISDNPSAVKNFFSGDSGFATKLSSTIDDYTASDGILQSRINSLNSHVSDLADQKTALDKRMQAYEKQLQQQYTALDSLVSSLNNTSTYLTQQLNALTNSNSKN
ncbi:flagellar filament capping protein FliD [Oleiagrimonas sp. C23AA]|uniref:flagellar filament capping protein FliD n=1 Tax=Oleiagrimonas sp. C23AA TaxID=2719047 RepID=UPI00141E45FD|nr:flagellar filament capping protein FliD [Oleiagrimonas sp. C23AA]NII09202.1 flagellar filament capping protein FliD [Oleiagrimonas sp. C23AA]